MTTHESIDPTSRCPGLLLPISFRGPHGSEHRGRHRCNLCGYRTTRYSFGWTITNPLSPAQLRRIAEALAR